MFTEPTSIIVSYCPPRLIVIQSVAAAVGWLLCLSEFDQADPRFSRPTALPPRLEAVVTHAHRHTRSLTHSHAHTRERLNTYECRCMSADFLLVGNKRAKLAQAQRIY